MNILHSAIGGLAAILLATMPVSSALAQDAAWPKSYVRMVVPGGSGTAADVAARLIGQHLSELWGQQTIVENRPGAGGMTGTTHIAQSPPDGHSLLFAQGAPLSLTPHAFTSIPYDVERDFEPVIFVGVVPLVLASNVKLPVKTIPELIAMASKQPGKLTFATASSRSIPHLAGEYFKQAAKVDLLHVPYVGYPQALGDTMSGTVDLIFGGAQIVHQREAGKLHMLGVTTAKRLPDYADIPSIGESVPGYAVAGWVALMAPKNTPAAVVAKINADVKTILGNPKVASSLQRLGIYSDTVNIGTPEALTAYIREDSALMQRILSSAGLKPIERRAK